MDNFIVERANPRDCDELLGLYLSIYGDDYPLEIGTNKRVMLYALENPQDYYWYVYRDQNRKSIAGSAIFELDRDLKIGKVTGVVVHNSYRGLGIAQKLIAYGTQEVLEAEHAVHSLYATSRTVALASQRMLLSNGFLPLGIFPNARKIRTYETLALTGKFAPGVLERRVIAEKIPTIMAPLYGIMAQALGDTKVPQIVDCTTSFQKKDDFGWGAFEFIEAPNFVEKRFDVCFKDDPESQFYPFHRPNLLIASTVSDTEIYATFSRKDHYCVIITANKSFREMKESFKGLIFAMKEVGIYYVEILVRADYFETICFLTQNKFLPSALYPAMREENGQMQDYVLLTRTMVPLDYSEMNVDQSLRPYLTQYTEEWLRMHHLDLRSSEEEGE